MFTKQMVIADLKRSCHESNSLTSYDDYDLVYPWSNEPLINEFKYAFVKDKRVLCVTSSGDHAIHALINGAKDVTCFDINRYCKYYASLKTAMVKNLEYDKFHNCFKSKSNFFHNVRSFTSQLSFEESLFWSERLRNEDDVWCFFCHGFRGSNELFNLKGYQTAKARLNGSNIRYVDADLLSLYNKVKERFDVVFISNILDHVCFNSRVKNVVEVLSNITTSDGVIYDYSFLLEPRPERFLKPLKNYFDVDAYHFTNDSLNVYRKRKV